MATPERPTSTMPRTKAIAKPAHTTSRGSARRKVLAKTTAAATAMPVTSRPVSTRNSG